MEKLVVFGQNWLYLGKVGLNFGKIGFNWAKLVLFDKVFEQIGCISAKFVLFGKIKFYCGKMLVFIWPNWLHFGKIGSIRENCF